MGICSDRRAAAAQSAWARGARTAVIAAGLAVGAHAEAGLIEFDSFESWTEQAGAFTTLTFSEFDALTFITDQYEDRGVVFRSSSFTEFGPDLYVQDEWGLDGFGAIDVRFAFPVVSLAVHFPGSVDFRFHLDDELLLETKSFYGPSGVDNFIGITPGFAFDRVEIVDLAVPGDVTIDNLYFTPVPVPAAGLLMLGPLLVGRRRR